MIKTKKESKNDWNEYKKSVQKNRLRRNASQTQRGFNYQNYAGLYLLIRYMNKFENINIEGTEDIEIKFADRTVGFYQVKEVKNYSETLTTDTLKKAIGTLVDDIALYDDDDKIATLCLITNSDSPITKKYSRKLFYDKRININFEELEDKSKKYIKEQIPQCAIDHFDCKKFSITKLAYIGGELEDKLQLIFELSNKLFQKAGIEKEQEKVINEWTELLINITEKPESCLTKEEVVYHTQVKALEDPNFDLYFNEMKCDFGERAYIRTEYPTYLRFFEDDFEIKNIIIADFDEYRSNNIKSESVLYDFIKVESSRIYSKYKNSKTDEDKEDEDKDIYGLIIYQIILSSSKLKTIEKAFGYENKNNNN